MNGSWPGIFAPNRALFFANASSRNQRGSLRRSPRNRDQVVPAAPLFFPLDRNFNRGAHSEADSIPLNANDDDLDIETWHNNPLSYLAA
jgi:hypothetical protein